MSKNTEMKADATQATTANNEANLLNAPVVTLPRLDPHDRPASTREPDSTPIRQSYEDVQREARGPGADEWRQVDEARRQLGELYRTLQEDERYSEEHKALSAWRRYEEVRAKVEALSASAREKMRRSADTLERLSIPHPEGESLSTQNTDKLLLTAHERSRLEGMLNRAESQTKGPFRRDPVDILKAEYERGLDEGGPGGGATVRAVHQLCRDYGYDINRIVDGRRRDVHHGALEDAGKARMRALMVSRSVPKPPFQRPGTTSRNQKGTGTYGAGGRMFAEGSKTVYGQKRRRRAW
jgi:hypothetical protein